jgi:hypothetical protein
MNESTSQGWTMPVAWEDPRRRKRTLSRNCPRKRERFPTAIVEYGEKEVRELLALERPQKKKDNSKVMCFNCKELGHYANKCPVEDNKANSLGSVKKNLNFKTSVK